MNSSKKSFKNLMIGAILLVKVVYTNTKHVHTMIKSIHFWYHLESIKPLIKQLNNEHNNLLTILLSLVRRPLPELFPIFLNSLLIVVFDLLFLVFCLREVFPEVVSLLSVPSSDTES